MVTNGQMIVNNIRLPDLYARFLGTEKSNKEYWDILDRDRWISLFPKEEIERPLLYPYNLLMLINERWSSEQRENFLGKSDNFSFPGFLNPQTSVLIGELATDSLIALDFSTSLENPSVCHLRWYAPHTNRWTYVAESVDTLLRGLGVFEID